MVIHAIAEGVLCCDLLDYCRTDRVIALRPVLGKRIIKRAVSRIGTPYDFSFNFRNFDALCCSEFVYWCYLEVADKLNLLVKTRKVMGIKKEMIEPDAFMPPRSKMRIVWTSDLPLLRINLP
jgi:hypothetical protein